MEYKALKTFLRKPVNSEMIHFLVNTTNSVIQIKPNESGQPSAIPSLYKFIEKLIKYSNVQTPTLMSTIIYLNRLRENLPSNSNGMETTRHRIFVGCLILASKNLNDSSPLNKHWCTYTDGLINLKDINLLELELLNFIGYNNLIIRNRDLISNLSFFVEPIKLRLIEKEFERQHLIQQKDIELTRLQQQRQQRHNNGQIEMQNSYSNMSIPSLVSSTSSSTIDSISSESSIKIKNLETTDSNYTYSSHPSLKSTTYNSKPQPEIKLKEFNLVNKNYQNPNSHSHHHLNGISNKENIAIY